MKRLIAWALSLLLAVAPVSAQMMATGIGGGGFGGAAAATTTWNPSDAAAQLGFSGGNLIATQTGAASAGVRAIASHSTGTYYYEVKYTTVASSNNNAVGIGNASSPTAFPGNDNNSIGWTGAGTVLLNVGAVGSGAASWAQNDVLGIAVDMGNKKIWFKNVTAGSGWNNDILANQNPAVGSQVGGLSFATMGAAPWFPMANGASNADSFTANFGATAYGIVTPPTGYINW